MRQENRKIPAARLLRKTALLCAVALFAIFPAVADDSGEEAWEFDPEREEITDKALEQFGIALTIFQQLQDQTNGLITEAIEVSSLSEEAFLELHNTQITEPERVLSEFDDDQVAAYNEAMEDIAEIQEEMQQQMVETVMQLGFTVENFNELSRQIQEDPQLYERLEEVFSQLQDAS
jgi:hypothetical protein